MSNKDHLNQHWLNEPLTFVKEFPSFTPSAAERAPAAEAYREQRKRKAYSVRAARAAQRAAKDEQ